MKNWYVFQIRPQREADAKLAIRRAFGISGPNVWVPWQAHVTKANRHTKALKVRSKLIPGYLFVKSDYPLQPYMVSGSNVITVMLRQGDELVTISNAAMQSMKSAIREDAREKLRSIRKTRKPADKRTQITVKLADLAKHPEAKKILRDMLSREVKIAELEVA